MDALLSFFGLKKATAAAAFIGALISLKFVEDVAKLSLWKRGSTVLSGAVVAAYCTPLTVHILEIPAPAEGAIAFLGGLFGMSLAGAIINKMPDLIDAAKERIGGK